jgi:hypothetical protein
MSPSDHGYRKAADVHDLEDLLPYASTGTAAGERRTEVKREDSLRVQHSLTRADRQVPSNGPCEHLPAPTSVGVSTRRTDQVPPRKLTNLRR